MRVRSGCRSRRRRSPPAARRCRPLPPTRVADICGLRACAHVASGLRLRRALPAASGPALEEFWDRTMRTAKLAAEVAGRLNNVGRDSAHTYVLFRDSGMLVRLRKFPEFAEIMERGATLSGGQLTCVEDARFKFDRALHVEPDAIVKLAGELLAIAA